MSITSELRTTEGNAIPLLGVEVDGEVLGAIARTIIRQRYKNAESKPIEAIYTFPLPSESALVGFAMTCGGRKMQGIVKEREKAFLEYDEAIAQGHGAALVDQERRNVFTASIGNLLPGEETIIEVEILERLTADEGALRWSLPTLVAPRYIPGSPAGDRTAHGVAHPTTSVPDADRTSPPIGTVNYGIAIDVRFMLGDTITVESPSHVTDSQKIEGGVRVRFSSKEVALDRDIVITARGVEGLTSAALAHRVAGEDGYVAITVVPDLFAFAKPSRRQQVVFLVDISGSMGGTSIEQARAALRLCLRQLREGDLFNVIAFDHLFTCFEKDLVPFTQRTLDAADTWVSSLETNGGTELLAPLCAAAKMAKGGVVVLLTDGQVGNEAEILSRVLDEVGGARLYTFGIGTNVSDVLLRDLAKRTNGACELIYPGERIDDKVIAQFARATAARVDSLDVKTPGLDLGEMAPSSARALVDGEPWVVFARYSKPGEGALELRGKIDGEPFFLRVPVLLPASADRPAIAKLWARERIAELEGADVSGRRAEANKGRILKLALDHGLASSLTSMVVVETREGDRRAHGVPDTRVVAVNAPHGWAMFQNATNVTRSGILGAVSPSPAQAFGAPPPAPGAMPSRAAPMAASSQGGAPRPAPAAPAKSGPKGKSILSRALDYFAPSEGESVSNEVRKELAASERSPSDMLSEQLANGLWDDPSLAGDPQTRQVRATALMLLTLHEAGITTAHAMYGAQLKKALEALLKAVDSIAAGGLSELALCAAWLVASGTRSRTQVANAAQKRGLALADENDVRSRAEALRAA